MDRLAHFAHFHLTAAERGLLANPEWKMGVFDILLSNPAFLVSFGTALPFVAEAAGESEVQLERANGHLLPQLPACDPKNDENRRAQRALAVQKLAQVLGEVLVALCDRLHEVAGTATQFAQQRCPQLSSPGAYCGPGGYRQARSLLD
jgi:hypothetical protein